MLTLSGKVDRLILSYVGIRMSLLWKLGNEVTAECRR